MKLLVMVVFGRAAGSDIGKALWPVSRFYPATGLGFWRKGSSQTLVPAGVAIDFRLGRVGIAHRVVVAGVVDQGLQLVVGHTVTLRSYG